jgi:hypothetical protein
VPATLLLLLPPASPGPAASPANAAVSADGSGPNPAVGSWWLRLLLLPDLVAKPAGPVLRLAPLRGPAAGRDSRGRSDKRSAVSARTWGAADDVASGQQSEQEQEKSVNVLLHDLGAEPAGPVQPLLLLALRGPATERESRGRSDKRSAVSARTWGSADDVSSKQPSMQEQERSMKVLLHDLVARPAGPARRLLALSGPAAGQDSRGKSDKRSAASARTWGAADDVSSR